VGQTVEPSPIVGLGYVVVESDARDEWRRFARDVLGMMVDDSSDERLLLRMDDRVARLVVEPPRPGRDAATGELGVVAGWECRSEAAWHGVYAALERAAAKLESVDPPRAWCKESFACVDPSGLRCEYFYGGRVDPATPFVSPLGVSFVTQDQALGHITIGSRDVRGAVAFYEGLLGFEVRETKTTGTEQKLQWAFLSPNTREHSLALIGAGDESRVLHILIEVTELDAVGRAMDRCLDGLAPMSVSLGRHWNDQMVSFYARTPSGFDVEYGFGGRTVEAGTWSVREQGGSELVSLWGHRVVGPDGRLGRQIGQH
jgi:3,4-dihydroxy-9,10-secoandrosta-1,3,5(10)-triene-9,17-dione 4,5-dioxygenase